MLCKLNNLRNPILILISMLIFIFSGFTNAQISKQDAIDLALNEILAEDIGNVDIYISSNPVYSIDSLHLWNKKIPCPYNSNWVVFVDDNVFANWEHSCRYIFINTQFEQYQVMQEFIFPADMEIFETVSSMERPVNQLIEGGNGIIMENAPPNPHLYAVIINGSSEIRHWNNMSAIFCTLTQEYGYLPENIFVHSTDGTINHNYLLDLDGGSPSIDIDADATQASIENTFQYLAETIAPDDQLFIYTTGHGTRVPDLETGNESCVLIWGDQLRGSELKQMLAPINASEIIVAMSQCNSGGFITDAYEFNITGPHRVIYTACEAEGLSYAELWITGENYDEFVFYWTAVVRGYYPGLNPWEINEEYPVGSFNFSNIPGHPGDRDPDINGDGIIQMKEAIEYADYMDSWSDDRRYNGPGYYNPYPPWVNIIETPVEYNNIGFQEDLLNLSGISGNITNTQEVNGNFMMSGDLNIANGITISVDPASNLYFTNGSSLRVNGTLTSLGVSGDEITYDFIDNTGDGIVIKNGGSVFLDYCDISNATTGISTFHFANEILISNSTFEDFTEFAINIGPNVVDFELSNSNINNCEDYCVVLSGPFTNTPEITGSDFNNSYGGISATNLNEIIIQENQFVNNDIGIYLSNVTQPYVLNNNVTSNKMSMPGIFLESCGGELRGDTISGHTNGIHLGNSSPDIGGNTITDNLYHGIYVGSGSLPNMIGELAGSPPLYYPIAGYNDIFDNGGWDDPQGPNDNDGSEIYLVNSNVLMRRGCNSIVDDRIQGGNLINTQLLMNSNGDGLPIEVRVEYNFWGNHPVYPLSTRFGSLVAYYDPSYSEPCSLPEGSSGGGSELLMTSSNGEIVDTVYSVDRELGDLSTTELLYAVAEEKFLAADYENAEAVYNQIINSNDTLFAKLKAHQRLYNLGRLTNKGSAYFSDLKTVYSSLSQSATDSLLGKIFKQLASLSLVGQTEYVSAIEEFDAVVQQNQGTEEAMYAEIDALTTALLLAPDSSLGKGSLGKYAVTDISDYTNRVRNLLKQKGGNGNYNKEPIPIEYALYQNYPNPFNPSTTIKYSMVKSGKVKLAVYDILGREVLVLADEEKAPGFYEVNFDASYLSSGVYFYRIVTEDYVNTKKMLLLK